MFINVNFYQVDFYLDEMINHLIFKVILNELFSLETKRYFLTSKHFFSEVYHHKNSLLIKKFLIINQMEIY